MRRSLLAASLGGEKPSALRPTSLHRAAPPGDALEHPPSPTAGCSKPDLLTLKAKGASSRLDWALPAGRAGWEHGDTKLIVTMFLSWFHRGTPSVLSGSLKRHFEPAGDPSSSAAAEPIAALGFVPSATVMPVVLSPAHIPVPGCPQRGVLSAGWESICSAGYGRNGLSSAATCWLQLVSLCVWKLLSHSLNH